MRSAVDDYQRTVDGMPFIAPIPPVVGNVRALPLLDPNDMRVELPAQLTSPVLWTATVRYMIGQGVTTFVELGVEGCADWAAQADRANCPRPGGGHPG